MNLDEIVPTIAQGAVNIDEGHRTIEQGSRVHIAMSALCQIANIVAAHTGKTLAQVLNDVLEAASGSRTEYLAAVAAIAHKGDPPLPLRLLDRQYFSEQVAALREAAGDKESAALSQLDMDLDLLLGDLNHRNLTVITSQQLLPCPGCGADAEAGTLEAENGKWTCIDCRVSQ